MDYEYWYTGNDTFNFTDDFKFCEMMYLGDIVSWSLAVYMLIIVFGAISNILLLFAIYKNPLKCFSNPTTYFVANLGIVDLLNSIFNLEELLLSQTEHESTFCLPGAWGMIHSTFASYIFFLLYPSVAIMALERYVSVAHPLWHQVNVTSRVCYISITAVWLVNCIYTGIYRHFTHVAGILPSYPIAFYLTTVLVYLLAFTSIRKQRLSLGADISQSKCVKQMMKLRLRNENRFLTTVLIVNIVLVFGIIPSILDVINMHSKYPAFLLYTTDILFLINTAVNPLLYLWRLPKYRKTFFVLYCGKT
ncbi:adrenocorticotropic hormone receptor-like [Dendronephthya gigantea]|uniref:adrenocorticotropic hormone receptor-like n=1 Tax=Dendronephthya gigantea TaxID=151771 RepID=UPI00106C79B7|nr:adrenocorticotropic hormone receptor-like [Dendronephthya gigantea]